MIILISLDISRTISEEYKTKNLQFCSNLEEILEVFFLQMAD